MKYLEKRLFYVNFILEQVIAAAHVATDVDSYECGTNKVKIVRPLYHVATGKFKGLVQAIDVIRVRQDPEEIFL